CQSAEELPPSYEDSIYALDLYYFTPNNIIQWNGEPHTPKATNEEFDEAIQQVFHSIVTKSGELENNVDKVLDIVFDLHYGNKNAAFNRVMVFTGDLCQLLYANRLLTGSFSQRQDALQKDLESCDSFMLLRRVLKNYYISLSRDIYSASNRRSTQEIYKVQQYILEHFSEELTLKTLAEIACVSPHYFSAYFKAETGQNYKAFLTHIRMENALNMVLNSDLKTYEIAEKVGYNNVRRFVDAFRAAYGMSPSDYRKSNK
ncbi:MAG: helix-turn-helix transcriptional regulator, partial [Oscillospiraceae bacterium]|nr:helix-turn-helix transcriptional regulator [Oscillospiraceae bacterium]